METEIEIESCLIQESETEKYLKNKYFKKFIKRDLYLLNWTKQGLRFIEIKVDIWITQNKNTNKNEVSSRNINKNICRLSVKIL